MLKNPQKNFMPAPGDLEIFDWSEISDGVRIDTGFKSGDEVTHFYDPMIAKVICHAEDRSKAINKMIHALDSIVITGLTTNVDFLRNTLRHEVFQKGDVFTGFIDTFKSDLLMSIGVQ